MSPVIYLSDLVYASRVHIRRTDKVGTEAAFHPLEEYMAAVDEYYSLLEMKQKVDRRRVYLASDDPKVIAEAHRK
jgi:glycoprotein 6-alpha-L-fucosyltransferase